MAEENLWDAIPSIKEWNKLYDEHKSFVGFWSGNKDKTTSYMCNFYEAKHDAVFSERDFMLGKAVFFDDADSYEKILLAKTAKDVKSCGREVKNFDKEKWDPACLKYMYRACMNKFTDPKNSDILRKLWSTYPYPLAETSPFDDIWGIKMSIDDTSSCHPSKYGKIWKGDNLLGRVLMVVRHRTWNDRFK